jgi:hypothetical protein
MIDCSEILLARNRTKLQHKVYTYEAMKNMLDGFAGNSISENFFGIVAAFLEQTGHKMDFLKPCDKLIIKNIRRVLAQKQ